jgi:hypothetical protein
MCLHPCLGCVLFLSFFCFALLINLISTSMCPNILFFVTTSQTRYPKAGRGHLLFGDLLHEVWLVPVTKRPYIIWLNLYEMSRQAYRDKKNINGLPRTGREAGTGEWQLRATKGLVLRDCSDNYSDENTTENIRKTTQPALWMCEL